MFDIHLQIDYDLLLSSDVEIFIDKIPTEFSIIGNCINITTNVMGFFHVLQLRSKTNKRFNIEQVHIGGCDLRKLIFLSYMINNRDETFQPSTELWEADQTWTLPFGYPVSGWLQLVENKIPNGVLGQNLSALYEIFYPLSLKLDPSYPQILRDFFEFNFDFTLVDKDNLTADQVPYLSYNKPIDQDLITEAKHEVQANLANILASGMGLDYGQKDQNFKEFKSLTKPTSWHIIWLRKELQDQDVIQQFPKVNQLIRSLGLDHWHSFIGILPAGGFIYPHRDFSRQKSQNSHYQNYSGCTQLYIPLTWPSDSWIKFGGAGILNFNLGQPMVINNDHFTHALVNQSDQPRITVGLRCHRDIIDHCDFFNPAAV